MNSSSIPGRANFTAGSWRLGEHARRSAFAPCTGVSGALASPLRAQLRGRNLWVVVVFVCGEHFDQLNRPP